MGFKNHESELLERLGFDVEVVELLKIESKAQLLPFEPEPGTVLGTAVRVSDGDAAEKFIKALQPRLLQKGYRLFWTNVRDAYGSKPDDAVALLHSTDHFSIVDASKPCAESHPGPELIRDKIRSFESICDLEVVGAAHDWVAVTFKTLPGDLCSFAEDVYLFCPDSCDLNSGIGEKRENKTAGARAAAKALCPALSQKFLDAHREMFAHQDSETYEMLLDDAKWSVRLLAKKLKAEMYFFFWWD
jgi:hypothetical protein